MSATLEAVVLMTPDQETSRPSIERVAAQSRGAREALSLAAELSGAGERDWSKDGEDAPLPSDGWHWSVSHDAAWAAAVVGRERVGIDVERMQARRDELVEALLSPAERELLPGPIGPRDFARLWTAKEAVLKSVGVGLGELSRCVLLEPMGEDRVVLEHRGERCLVRQRFHGDHVLSVHTPGEDWEVRWHVAPPIAPDGSATDHESRERGGTTPEPWARHDPPQRCLALAARAAAALGDAYPFEARFLPVDGGWMHVVDEGDPASERVLLALHGNPTWSFLYRRVVSAFAGDMRVVVPDHIGCGLSDKPTDWRYDLDGHVANVVHLIEELDLSSITLLVHDWGGAIGMGAALLMPERIDRLVVTNTAAFPSTRMPWRIRLCRTPLLGRFAVQAFNAFARAATTMAVERPLDRETKRGFLFPYDSWAHRVATWRFVHDIPMSPRHPSFPLLAQIGAQLDALSSRPTCILWGERDWCFTPHFRREWEARFPAAESHPIAGAGHYLFEDAGDEVLAILRAFLERR